MPTLRLFIATALPPPVCQALTTLRSPTFDARWTPPEQFHLTLAFLGATAEERVAALTDTLDTVRASPFRMRLHGLGVFPSHAKPRVLVVHLLPKAALLQLHERIQLALAELGFPSERRRFRPHVTLARLKHPQPAAVRRYLETTTLPSLPPFELSAFHLYQSTLRPEGALHERLASFSLIPDR